MGVLDVVTVGHAIVDVLAYADDGFVDGLGLAKGTMTLVDDARAEEIYTSLGETTSVSGGSAANTAVCLASFGRRAGFVGKVRRDELGGIFAEDIKQAGVDFGVPPGEHGPGTGRSMILVTPDAEKTMCTSLGIGDLVGPDDVDTTVIASASVLYIEGYLCGLPHTDPTLRVAIDAARSAGRTVALSLSDPFWVELHGAELERLLPDVDLLFANEHEALTITGAASVDGAVDDLARRCGVVVVTLGSAGSVVARGDDRVRVPAVPVPQVVDTTGAGDSFAAGFLHGFLAGDDLEVAARLGSLAAAEIISHLGARPQRSLREMAADAGLS